MEEKENYSKEEVIELLDFVSENYSTRRYLGVGPWNLLHCVSPYVAHSHEEVIEEFHRKKEEGLEKKL